VKNKLNKIYKSLIIRKNEIGNYNLKIEKVKIRNLKKNEVLINVKYTSLNYKDILVCNGNPGLVRRYPHTPGIDASGIVVKSKSKKFKKNDKVVIVARPNGINNDGGLSQYIYIKSNNLEKLPKNISLKQSMIIGTAGFTAALSVNKLINKNDYKKDKSILVSGSTGGIGTISILLLKNLGCKVTAITNNYKKTDFLNDIGVDNIIELKKFNKNYTMPLNRMKYDGFIDTIGGDVINSGSKQLKNNSSIMLVGNICKSNFELNIMPFIIRGINLIGINAESCKNTDRKKAWKTLYKIVCDKKLKKIYKECAFNQVINQIKNFNNKNRTGKILVKIS